MKESIIMYNRMREDYKKIVDDVLIRGSNIFFSIFVRSEKD